MFDGKAFGAEIVAAVKAHVADMLARVAARLDEIERRLDQLPVPRDGKDADPAAIVDAVRGRFADELLELRQSINGIGKAPASEQIRGLVADAVDMLPKAPTDDAIKAMVEQAVMALPLAQAGKDPDPDRVAALVAEAVARAVTALPVPKDGRDGLDVKDLLVVEGGELVATFADGRSKNLGPFRGKDGRDGKDGEAGKDGRDGFGFDDLDVTHDGGRSFSMKFARAGDVKEFAFELPVMIYRGVWSEGAYRPGDTVTWGGSLWHCDEPSTEKPDGPSKQWTLCAKRGRDGKDGVLKEPKVVGPIKVG